MDEARRSLRVIAFAVVASACGSTPPATRSVPPSTCEQLIARYRATLATRTDRCATDADCAVYGGVDPDDVCGGATDATTGRALATISDEMDAAGCARAGYSCPPIGSHCAAGSCR